MPESPPSHDPDRLVSEALDGLIVLKTRTPTTAETQRLERWRSQSPEHEAAWRNALALWEGLEPLRGRPLSGSSPLPLETARANLAEAIVRPRRLRSETDPALSRSRGTAFPRHSVRLGWAIACLFILIAGLVFLDPMLALQADYRTAKGEIHDVLLPDGSRASLNSDSAVAVRFEHSTRRIELLRGEAFFEVAKDPARPFVAASRHGEAKAVGTAFTVRQSEEKTEIAMLEGVVEASTFRLRVSLKAGQAASLEADGRVVLRKSGVDHAAAWREGYLIFDQTPLAEVVATLNRYRKGRVTLLNESFADRRLSGLFRLADTDRVIDAIAETTPLRITRLTDYWVILR